MIRLEFIVLATLGFATGLGISWWSSQNQDAIHSVSECADELWREHEDRTGLMPSIALEKAGWSQCAEIVSERADG